MNFNQLKDLVRKFGSAVIVNGDGPEFVVLSYEQFSKFDQGKLDKFEETSDSTSEASLVEIDRLNKEISALKDGIRQKEEAELFEDQSP